MPLILALFSCIFLLTLFINNSTILAFSNLFLWHCFRLAIKNDFVTLLWYPLHNHCHIDLGFIFSICHLVFSFLFSRCLFVILFVLVLLMIDIRNVWHIFSGLGICANIWVEARKRIKFISLLRGLCANIRGFTVKRCFHLESEWLSQHWRGSQIFFNMKSQIHSNHAILKL